MKGPRKSQFSISSEKKGIPGSHGPKFLLGSGGAGLGLGPSFPADPKWPAQRLRGSWVTPFA